MTLKLDTEKLKELMQDFFVLTNIRIVFFDESYNEILAYPENHSAFCQLMHSGKNTEQRCLDSNKNSFEQCKKTGELILYRCHAGLIEATTPLKSDGVVIGYVMFGQIAGEEQKKNFAKNLPAFCRQVGLDEQAVNKAVKKIRYKNEKQVRAAAKILEVCASYVLLNQLVSRKKQQFVSRFNEYIEKHIDEDITVNDLCREFGVCLTKLYEVVTRYFGTGVSAYIMEKRLELAKCYLEKTGEDISVISRKVGFNDYNYFCRIFKRETGIPAKKYRRLRQSSDISRE